MDSEDSIDEMNVESPLSHQGQMKKDMITVDSFSSFSSGTTSSGEDFEKSTGEDEIENGKTYKSRLRKKQICKKCVQRFILQGHDHDQLNWKYECG